MLLLIRLLRPRYRNVPRDSSICDTIAKLVIHYQQSPIEHAAVNARAEMYVKHTRYDKSSGCVGADADTLVTKL